MGGSDQNGGVDTTHGNVTSDTVCTGDSVVNIVYSLYFLVLVRSLDFMPPDILYISTSSWGMQALRRKTGSRNLGLLVDPVELGVLVGLELLGGEPEGNLLLGVLDAVGTVADVAADVLFSGE